MPEKITVTVFMVSGETNTDDLSPATLGVGSAYSGDGHEDRRCEDGLTYENGDIPLIAVERGGELDALVMAYAVHGTVLTIDDLTLSQDVSGGIEQAVADRFDREVLVTMFNSWGGDMAPGSPELTLQEGAERPEGYDQMEQVGAAVADAVLLALDDIVWQDEPTIAASTHRSHIDREWIGYDDDTFPFEYGGVYCEVPGEEADCDPDTTIEPCLPRVTKARSTLEAAASAAWSTSLTSNREQSSEALPNTTSTRSVNKSNHSLRWRSTQKPSDRVSETVRPAACAKSMACRMAPLASSVSHR